MPAPLRIAWFTPLKDETAEETIFSKSQYASSILLPLLKDKFEIELFSARAGQTLGELRSKHFLTAWTQHQQKPFDLFFYNLENGKHCDFCRLHLALAPGITWFHDFTLIDDGPEPILNSPWTRMVEAFHANAEQTLSWPTKSEQYLPKRPQALRETGMSFYSLFSAERDLEQFRQINPLRLNYSDNGSYLPLPVEIKNIVFNQRSFASDRLKVATNCQPRVEAHIHSLLQAQVNNKDIELTWLIDRSEKTKCQELISEFQLNNVRLVEGRSVETWSNILKETDLAIHFLYTFYQHSNPWLSLSLAQGVFCAVLDFSESDFLPADCAIRIYPGASEISQIKAVFELLKKSAIRRNFEAYSFANEQFNAAVIAGELSEVLYRLTPRIQILNSRWEAISNQGRKNLLSQNLMNDEKMHTDASSQIYTELGWQ